MNSILAAELCPNCHRPPSRHRPWCANVETMPEHPKQGDIINHPIFGLTELISVYTREQAISDGILVDCTEDPFDKLNRAAGLKFDVALTRAVFERYVEVPENSTESEDIAGRYWNMILMFSRAARRKATGMELLFDFICVPNGSGCWPNEKPGPSSQQRLLQLKAVSGPGDRGEPCLTFMLPTED